MEPAVRVSRTVVERVGRLPSRERLAAYLIEALDIFAEVEGQAVWDAVKAMPLDDGVERIVAFLAPDLPDLSMDPFPVDAVRQAEARRRRA
jgi:hypothetical protein